MDNTTPAPTPDPIDIHSPQPTQGPPTPKSNSALVITLTTLMVIAIGAATYYFLQYQKLASTAQLLSTPFPTTSPIEPSNSIDNWKTYEDTTNHVTFKYPPKYFIEAQPRDGGDGFTYLFAPDYNHSIAVFVTYDKPQADFYMDSPSVDEILIGNTSWKTYFLPQGYPDGAVGVGNPIYALQAEVNQKLVSVTLNNQSSLSDEISQVLSTFSFTGQTRSFTTPPGSNRYTSEKLGVSFYYQIKQGEETFSVKEMGNKIYVHSNLSPPDQGQYLEVFEKSSSDTLVDAINKTILTGYSQTDCVIDQNTVGFNTSKINPSFQIASLTVEVEGEKDLEKVMQKAANCPIKYMAIGGLNYFLSDPKYPTKFLFVSIGQYAIQGDSEKLWQDTLEFID